MICKYLPFTSRTITKKNIRNGKNIFLTCSKENTFKSFSIFFSFLILRKTFPPPPWRRLQKPKKIFRPFSEALGPIKKQHFNVKCCIGGVITIWYNLLTACFFRIKYSTLVGNPSLPSMHRLVPSWSFYTPRDYRSLHACGIRCAPLHMYAKGMPGGLTNWGGLQHIFASLFLLIILLCFWTLFLPINVLFMFRSAPLCTLQFQLVF